MLDGALFFVKSAECGKSGYNDIRIFFISTGSWCGV